MRTTYVSPKQSALCPECGTHPQQERGGKRGERLCSSGHTFTLDQSRAAERNQPRPANVCPFCYRTYEECVRDTNPTNEHREREIVGK